MQNPEGIPELVKCPYCGTATPLDSEFCGACYKKLHIPTEARAEAKMEKILRACSPPAPTDTLKTGGAPPAVRLWARLGIILWLFLFYTRWLSNRDNYSMLDYINLPFHEAGHFFLSFFGRFIMVLGGTIFQLLIPAVCLVYLRRRGGNLGWQLCLFWIGESLLNISSYAGDAVKRTLPLLFGNSDGHDWNYLLTETGLIAHTQGVANIIFLAGSAVIFYSFYLISCDARDRLPIELGNLELW